MNAQKFNEEFFASVCEMEVWKQLSNDECFTWTETLIERYQDKIDWKELSRNSNIQWNIAMLDKYKNRIDWDELSWSSCHYLFTSEIMRKFKSKWNWSKLSSNRSVKWTTEKIEEFKDSVDWKEIMDRSWDNLYSLEFFEKYKEHFPVSSLQHSQLWEHIVGIHKEKLIEKIISE
jgi:hypothetical protein